MLRVAKWRVEEGIEEEGGRKWGGEEEEGETGEEGEREGEGEQEWDTDAVDIDEARQDG